MLGSGITNDTCDAREPHEDLGYGWTYVFAFTSTLFDLKCPTSIKLMNQNQISTSNLSPHTSTQHNNNERNISLTSTFMFVPPSDPIIFQTQSTSFESLELGGTHVVVLMFDYSTTQWRAPLIQKSRNRRASQGTSSVYTR